MEAQTTISSTDPKELLKEFKTEKMLLKKTFR
jgi:hypothetical protein